MTRVGFFAAKETAVTSGSDAGLLPRVAPSDGGGFTGRTLHSKMLNSLLVAPRRRLWRSQPSAREGVWVNTAQPPDDPETSWPSTVFNPFASESGEMVVPTGPPTEDLVQLSETEGGYSCPTSPADSGGSWRLLTRRHGRHAAPSAGIGSRLARKLAANR
jgi:hypothetical protein